jgi:hypothetical protein
MHTIIDGLEPKAWLAEKSFLDQKRKSSGASEAGE